MRTTFPLVPIAAAALVRALAWIAMPIANALKAFARARRHRAQARALAAADGRMLADLGITRADLRDAFSEPFWEDPTALLRERALERRLNRGAGAVRVVAAREPQNAFLRPALNRPSRQTI